MIGQRALNVISFLRKCPYNVRHLSRNKLPVVPSSEDTPADLDGTLSAARPHHPATRHYTPLPFFPLTLLDFNHLLISLVVRGKGVMV